jgi:hypothetical protein
MTTIGRTFPLALVAVLVGRLATPAPVHGLQPERLLVDEASPEWDSAQIVSSDRSGHVFFFRGDTFEVYPVKKSGAFGEPIRLETAASSTSQMVHDAVLNPAGDRWLVYADLGVRLFVDGKETALPPLPWKPWSIAFLRDTPVVAVLPLPMGGESVDIEKVVTPPAFVLFDGERWNPVAETKGVSVSSLVHQGSRLNDAVAEKSVYMTGDRLGRLWAAGQYRYRLQRLAPSFRPSLEVVVDGGKVRKQKNEKPAVEIKRTGPGQNPSDAAQNPLKEKSTYTPFSGQQAAFDLTEGLDGKIYLLVRTEAGDAALDRFDPSLLLLERIPLDLKASGRYTIAAGLDGLYLAAWNGRQGRWRISWDALDQAAWKDVANCEIDGVPMTPSSSPEKETKVKH